MLPADVRAPLDFGIFQSKRRFCRDNAMVMSTMCSREYRTRIAAPENAALLDSLGE